MKKLLLTLIITIVLCNLIFISSLYASRNRKAIIIGIQNYENYAPLRGCHGDVESMSALLRMSGFEDDYIWIVKDDFNNPIITASNMYSNIMAFSRTIQQGDKVIFFFSGHGIGDRTGENYLLGYDGNMDAPERFSVTVNEIKTILKENNPAEVVMIIDACRDYVIKEGRGAGQSKTASLNTGRGVRIQEISRISTDFKPVSQSRKTSKRPTIIKTIYAASEGQKSFERRDRNHGIFTYYLTYLVHSPNSVIDVDMSRNGIISIEDLVVFADNRIQNYVRNNNLPKMNPVYQTEGAVSYDPFLLFRYNPEPVVEEIKTRKTEPIFQYEMEAELAKIRKVQADLSYLNVELPIYQPQIQQDQININQLDQTDLTSWRDIQAQHQEIQRRKAEEERKAAESRAKREEFDRLQNEYNQTIRSLEQTTDLNAKYQLLENARTRINRAKYAENRQRILPLLEPVYQQIKEAKEIQDREIARLKQAFIKDLEEMEEMSRADLPINIKEKYIEVFKTKWKDYVSKVRNNDLIARYNTFKPIETVITIDLGQGIQIEMILVQAGTFMMGTEASEIERLNKQYNTTWFSREHPQHRVTLTRDYYIGKYPVTQAQWEAVMGNNPSRFKGANRPVERVSWNDVQEFIKRLNRITRQNFRLPTEAEWEYAAKGGNKSKGYVYSGSNNINEVAWYSSNSNRQTHPVGRKKPNELGIYDMSGNVWEWCSDWFGDYPRGNVTDPTGARTGSFRVLRGGSWSQPRRELPVCSPQQVCAGQPGQRPWLSFVFACRTVKT